MAREVRPLNEITEDAIRILCQEIGVVNTARFINQFTTGFGDSTEERERIFADMSLDDLLSDIKQMRKE
ncbi:MAG: hypothetical protein EXR54_01805 [Dehalococcoidia bacterium]|nr:hypothetical protein [Dehalococcoidia bacterium]MSQ16294.1 hypothetical protein [Dehalococcoidia bacterium]